MIKSWGAFWALVGLVSLVAFGLWLDLSSPRPHGQYGRDHSSQAPENKNKSADYMAPALAVGGFLDAHNGAVSAATSVIIAAFTIVLALTTRGLSQATRGLQDFAAEQARDMKQSLAIAERAADGARRSADVAETALRDIERAFVYYKEFHITPPELPHSADSNFLFQFTWSNAGRT